MSHFPPRELPPLPPPPRWGRVTEEGRTASVIRFETKEGTFSWAWHTLSRWQWTEGDPQRLIIHVAGGLVTVSGRRLDVLRDALDAGRLERVQLMPERAGAITDAEPFIREITIAKQ